MYSLAAIEVPCVLLGLAVYCLQLTLDKVQGLDLYGERNAAVREPLNSDDIPKGEERLVAVWSKVRCQKPKVV